MSYVTRREPPEDKIHRITFEMEESLIKKIDKFLNTRGWTKRFWFTSLAKEALVMREGDPIGFPKTIRRTTDDDRTPNPAA